MSLAARPPILQPIPRQYATVTAMSLGMGMPSAARRAIGAGTSCGGMATQASFSNRPVRPALLPFARKTQRWCRPLSQGRVNTLDGQHAASRDKELDATAESRTVVRSYKTDAHG